MTINCRPHMLADIGLVICVPCLGAIIAIWLIVPLLLLMLGVVSVK